MSRGNKTQKMKLKVEDLVNNGPIIYLKCHAWSSVLEIKQSLSKVLKVLPSKLELFYKNLKLQLNSKTLVSYEIKPNDTITLKLVPNLNDSFGIINCYSILDCPSSLITAMVNSIKSGFMKGIRPKLSENGTSGSYFLQNCSHEFVGIFKPFDEEPFAPNNPKKYVGELGSQGFRKGIMSGESSARQVAAYMIDNKGFHGVPETTYVQLYHPSFEQRRLGENAPVKGSAMIQNKLQKIKTKHGSLQRFIKHDDTIGNFGGNCFSVQEIHKIAILDIRILNCDRNDENVLVNKTETSIENSYGHRTKKQYKLTPIDHGLSFPDSLEIYDYQVIWINFPQCLQPFSEKQLEFIFNIDPVKDCQLLKKKLNFRPICLRNFRISQILLKQAANAGLNLYEISQIIYRKQPLSDDQDKNEDKSRQKNLSDLQKIVQQAENIYFIVKKSGLKKTIEQQVGLIKPIHLQIIHKPKSHLAAIKQSKQSEQSQEQEIWISSRKQILHSQKISLKRSVSLPNMKDSSQTQNLCSKKHHKKQRVRQRTVKKFNGHRQQEQQEWQQLFFYYFEEMVKRFIKNKQNKQVKRGRYMSQNL